MALSFGEVVASGAIGAGIAAAFGFVRDRRLLDTTLRFQHRHEERNKLRELQSRYKGRVLEAALDSDRRMSQLYEGAYRWLDPPDTQRNDEAEYSYHSVIFRFLQLTAIARRFEAEAFYIDLGIAQRGDFDLLRHAKAFLWVMIHAQLSPDDGQPGIDHFRSDAFRPLLDFAYGTPEPDDAKLLPETRSREGELIFDLQRYLAMRRHAEALGRQSEMDELLAFFDGVRPDDYEVSGDRAGRQRRRWDRLVTLHLFVLAFIDDCGYVWHSDYVQEQTERAVQMLLYPETLAAELEVWLPRLGLDREDEFQRIRARIDETAAETSRRLEEPDERARRVYRQVQQNLADRRLAPFEMFQAPPEKVHTGT